ncbi:hypothetical protein ACZ11_07710 [Lysinibacillus xylanilyticus]|uniref:Uncharacterized protein n=1 Tax=Lysinibacillus xylanilyticus TaxID=582475 RepID=A0A0K9FCV3_9BACI|nr:hypothetical protein [Lysinibacillus xylanilyticus]KMY32043.1 hypothetical protein ACZ11_07710 [Lysinibacillus xylanilyticus]
MNDKKKGKLQISVIILMILLLVAAFVLLFIGHYSVAFVLFGIFIVSINSISNWLKYKNDDYIYRKNYNNNKW